MKMKNMKKMVVMAIVLLAMVIGGMILNKHASAEELVEETKGEVKAELITCWLNDKNDNLMDAVTKICDIYEEDYESVHVYSITWNDDMNRFEMLINTENGMVEGHIYQR